MNAAEAARAPAETNRVPLNMTQKTVARRMVQSAREIPQFSVSAELDADELAAWRHALNADIPDRERRITVTALLIWLTARTLHDHPRLNAQFDQDTALLHPHINMAVAMDTPDGLKAPVIRQAEDLSVAATADALKDLAARAAGKRLALRDFEDATFTISNLGMFGVSRFVPLVNPPQAAIMGVGGPRTAVRLNAAGQVVPAQTLELTITADHRVVDGACVARFLQALCARAAQRGAAPSAPGKATA